MEWTAVAAAAASIVAAALAFWSAGRARRSADGIDRRRHEIEHVDALSRSFQDAYGDFMRSLPAGATKSADVAPALYRAEILIAHPLADEELEHAVNDTMDYILRLVSGGKRSDEDINAAMRRMREATKTINVATAERRRALARGV